MISRVKIKILATSYGRRKFRRQKFRRQKFRRRKFPRISKSRNLVIRNFVVLIRINSVNEETSFSMVYSNVPIFSPTGGITHRGFTIQFRLVPGLNFCFFFKSKNYFENHGNFCFKCRNKFVLGG